MPENRKNILVCPLAWGAGHTTRMIPVIRELSALGHNVITAGEKWQNELIAREIPGITGIIFPGFSIRYSSFMPQYLVILLHLPVFLYSTITEHFRLKKIISRHCIDIVISDSRPGLWNREVRSVLITHMLRIPLPGLLRHMENLLLPFIRLVTGRFTFCYVPDLPGETNLSGKLSHNLHVIPGNVRYIGILSRFTSYPAAGHSEGEYYCVTIISGPSPQREIFLRLACRVLGSAGERAVIMDGGHSGMGELPESNITVVHAPGPREMIETIGSGRIIVSRPGYTTLMELFSLGRSALLVPTPGQPEQEYLSAHLTEKGWFRSSSQEKFNAECLWEYSESPLPPFPYEENRGLLVSALGELTDKEDY